MPPNNNKGIEVISLLDDSDVEDGAMASGGGVATIKRPSPTSVAASVNEREMKKKRRKESASTFVESSDAIELLDDSEDEAPAMGTKNVEASEPPAGDIKPTVVGATASATGPADSDIEEVEVSAPTTSTSGWRPAGGGSGQPKDDRAYDSDASGNGNDEQEKNSANDEEFEIVATKGQNALADFPHSRANCVTHPFASGGDKKAHCENCYCYVCDIPAADCKVWDSHCKANHEDRRWREERERFKRLGVEAALAPAPAPAAAVTSSTTVHGRQFASQSARRPTPTAEFSVRTLLQKLTTVHPVEISPPAESGFTTDLRHYQKQSLAFMVDVEKASATDNEKMRGGWLADEVGMGKTAVVLALVASNPMASADLPSAASITSHVASINLIERNGKTTRSVKKMKLKGTVVLTSVSLMGQWEDEIKKHAPGLVVKSFHYSRKKTANYIDLSKGHHKNTSTRRHMNMYRTVADVCDADTIVALSEADVIISSSTLDWPKLVRHGFKFHRVVQDESHLFYKGGASAKLEAANLILSQFRWGVTATPITASISGLGPQISFIDGGKSTRQGNDLRMAMNRGTSSQEDFNHLASLLGKVLIRHTKSQRINGSEALSLPPSSTTTTMLTMSQDEDRLFNYIHTGRETFRKHLCDGADAFTAERSFGYQMGAVLRMAGYNAADRPGLFMFERYIGNGLKKKFCYNPEHLTKVVALRNDLKSLRQAEPGLKAVVFTQFLEVHNACVRGLKADGFDVQEFTGSSNSIKRDEAIRNFQRGGTNRPSVFVITLRSGNVGITLTAASRVYLLEPCLDPATEVQAAGRIHRLGQDKPCHVVKFAFKNSYEANILKLHREILAGRMELVDGFVPHEAMKILAAGIRGSDVKSS